MLANNVFVMIVLTDGLHAVAFKIFFDLVCYVKIWKKRKEKAVDFEMSEKIEGIWNLINFWNETTIQIDSFCVVNYF